MNRRTQPEHHRAATQVPRNSGHPLQLILRAGTAAATTSNDEHVEVLAAAVEMAVRGDLDLGEVLVETMTSLTDADIAILRHLRDERGTEQWAEDPSGAPGEIVQRLVGLGLISFDGLYKRISQLGDRILDTSQA